MASPKFQFTPRIQDVFKTLTSVEEDLRNEVDNPLPGEIARVLDLLTQRDIQLEDYLSHLPVGSGGGLKYAVYVATLGAVTYSAGPDITFPGVLDTYTIPLTFGAPILNTPILPSGLGIVQIQGTIAVTTPTAAGSVQLFVGDNTVSISEAHGLPWVSNSTFNGRQYNNTLANFIFPPTTGGLALNVVQPNGSTPFGAGAFTFSANQLVVLQFS